MAEEGIRIAADAMPRLQRDPGDIAARGDALVAAWLCGTVMGSVTVGLHHKLCHTLGGSFDLPHAEVHAVILPQAMAYNAPAAAPAMARIARALGAASAPGGLFDLGRAHGAPTSLAAIGMRAADLDRAAGLAGAERLSEPAPARARGGPRAAAARLRRGATGLTRQARATPFTATWRRRRGADQPVSRSAVGSSPAFSTSGKMLARRARDRLVALRPGS
jgi:hypothetical protein